MNFLKKYWKYGAIIGVFYIIAYLFTPWVLQNKVVNQSDIASWRGMANEIIEHNKENPDDPALWTNSMFSGMPSTSISVIYKGDYTDVFYKTIHNLTGIRPPSYLLISLIGSFLLLLSFGVNLWLSAIGAFAITFCSYNMQIIQVGHNSKMVAIAFMPWVLASLVYSYRKNNFLGPILFAFALSFEIKANHPQITYYLAILVFGYAIAVFFKELKNRSLPRFFKTSALLLAMGLLGVASNINHLWPTYEYSKFTMRGGSELATEQGVKQKGLDISYATSWSYSPEEMPNLMIPNFNGGASSGALSTKSQTYQVLKSAGYQGAEQAVKSMPLYWGPQPFTAGPMYMGAIAVFLFIFAALIIGGAIKWWLIGATILAILLSWGSNFLFLTKLFFDYVPLYSKFRTVSMILVILQITLPLFSFILIDRLFFAGGDRLTINKKEFGKKMGIALLFTVGLSFIFIIIPSLAGSFVSSVDSQMPELLRGALISDRISLMRADAYRSIVFIILCAALLWYAFNKGIKREYLLVALSIIVFADLWSVGKRYLNESHFVRERDFTNQYQLRDVDRFILEDKDPHYRVLDMSVNTFNDSHVSYHHKTVGGYSPAKLQIYQDIIDMHISAEMQMIANDISQSKTIEEAQNNMGYYPVLSMLNSKYVILSGDNLPLINRYANGNAWFADSVVFVESLKEEIEALSKHNISNTAILNRGYSNISELISSSQASETDRVELTMYSPNMLKYVSHLDAPRLILFSEIYYPAGWRAYINGEEQEIIKANYLLRALVVPEGTSEIVMEFRPESFSKGAMWSRVTSALMIIILFSAIVLERKRVASKEANS